MNKLRLSKLIALSISCCFVLQSCNSSLFKKSVFNKTERHIAGSKRSSPKVREPRKVLQAKKQQEKRQAQIDKESDKFVKNSRKRSYEIQTADVKARMKQNESNIAARDRVKDKRIRSASKSRARKFR